jgi:predicted transcriptional regulator
MTVSTPLSDDIAKRLDDFCAEIHRTRAEVLRGLLYALLVDGKQFIFHEWREQAKRAHQSRA